MTDWPTDLQPAICEQCDWRYLAPPGSLPALCPHCFQASLTALPGDGGKPVDVQSPELYLPFTVTGDTLSRTI